MNLLGTQRVSETREEHVSHHSLLYSVALFPVLLCLGPLLLNTTFFPRWLPANLLMYIK